jgi:DNA helicase II / ATP-dependent DNA helicase PcrA
MLTIDQNRAIKHPIDRNLCIVAPPGSGKTECLTERAKHIIDITGVDESLVWMMTFSNKAAAELKSRLQKKLGRDTGVYSTNLHKACIRLLRFYANNFSHLDGVPSPDFTIIDNKDEAYLIDMFYQTYERADMALDLSKDLDVDDYEGGRETQRHFSLLKARDVKRPDRYMSSIKFELWKMLETHCIKHNLFGFDDLITRAVDLLTTHSELREATQALVRYILVDEYQDISASQERLINLIRGNAPISIVGDDLQSIFGFRGADRRHFLQFDERNDADTIMLRHNFRSTADIVKYSEYVFSDQSCRKHTREMKVPFRCEYNSIRKVPINNLEDEAKRVIHEIKILESIGQPLNEIAVLYRNHFHANELTKELLLAGIPHCVKGKFSFWDRREVRVVMAYINLALNPYNYSAFKTIASNFQGVGKVTIEECSTEEYETPLECLRNFNLAAYATISRHIQALCDYDSVEALMDMMVDEGAFGTLLDFDDDKARHNNLVTLMDIISNYEVNNLTELNEALYLQRDAQHGNADGVQLMTMHASKGCEFSAVFLLGFSRGSFPASGENVSIADEERLCFVALTRAKHLVYLMCHKDRPSVFLKRLPKHAIYDAETPPGHPYDGRTQYDKEKHEHELNLLERVLNRTQMATNFQKIEGVFTSLIEKFRDAAQRRDVVDICKLTKAEYQLLRLRFHDVDLRIPDLIKYTNINNTFDLLLDKTERGVKCVIDAI